MQRVLINGEWRESQAAGTFRSENPATREALADEFPVSSWADCDAALGAAAAAHDVLRRTSAVELARFLDRFAERIEMRAVDLVEIAHRETAFPKAPRLAEVELPRTTNQLRQAAAAARDGSWQRATIDRKLNIRSRHASIGPVCVFGPNNFPFAYGSASGGDFASAIATGNPVIAKANTSHPATTRMLAEEAFAAVGETSLPPATVQLLYRTSHADGERLVSDPRAGATGYTGSRTAGLALKSAADRGGKPIYLELSSVNPVVILPGALEERFDQVVADFLGSCLMGTGQFCTNPGLLVLIKGEPTKRFLAAAAQKFTSAAGGTLLSRGVAKSLAAGVSRVRDAGADVLAGDGAIGAGYSQANTLLQTTGERFLTDPELWQTEMFGNASLAVVARDQDELIRVVEAMEGNLTGSIYSDTRGSDDAAADQVAFALRPRVGRLLNDKMPTGVAVTAAMNHGGPYPATGHPGFTAVGFPAAMMRFTVLECYDNVRPGRLPASLRDKNPSAAMWRFVDGEWAKGH